jgi:hypothetical protein
MQLGCAWESRLVGEGNQDILPQTQPPLSAPWLGGECIPSIGLVQKSYLLGNIVAIREIAHTSMDTCTLTPEIQ